MTFIELDYIREALIEYRNQKFKEKNSNAEELAKVESELANIYIHRLFTKEQDKLEKERYKLTKKCKTLDDDAFHLDKLIEIINQTKVI